MAGESVPNHSAWAHGHTYTRAGKWTNWHNSIYAYKSGHRCRAYGAGKSHWLFNNEFYIYIHYRTSNSSGLYSAGGGKVYDNGRTYTRDSTSSRWKYLRWRVRYAAIYGDDEVDGYAAVRTYTAYYVRNVQDGRKIYRHTNLGSSSSGSYVNPSTSSGGKIYTSQNIIIP